MYELITKIHRLIAVNEMDAGIVSDPVIPTIIIKLKNYPVASRRSMQYGRLDQNHIYQHEMSGGDIGSQKILS